MKLLQSSILFGLLISFLLVSCWAPVTEEFVDIKLYRDSLGNFFSSTPITLQQDSGLRVFAQVDPITKLDSFVLVLSDDGDVVQKVVKGVPSFDTDGFVATLFDSIAHTGLYTIVAIAYHNDSLSDTLEHELELTLTPPLPSIDSLLIVGAIVKGGSYSLGIVAQGAETYQWYKDGVALVGEDSSVLEFSSLSEYDNGSYVSIVGNSGGLDTSEVHIIAVPQGAVLTVLSGVASPLTPEAGAVVTVLANDSIGYEFLYWSGEAYLLADSTKVLTSFTMPDSSVELQARYSEIQKQTLTILSGSSSPLAPEKGETVTILAKDSLGYTFSHWSGDAYLLVDSTALMTTLVMPDTSAVIRASYTEVGDAPSVTIQGAGTMVLGGTYSFKMSIIGDAASLSWYKDDVLLSGQVFDSLVLSSLSESHEGDYFAVVENTFGIDTSNTLSLSLSNQSPKIVTVIPPLVVEEGESFAPINLASHASDADGDVLSWSVTGGVHITAQVTGTVVQLFIDDENWNGTEILEFAVTDMIDTVKVNVSCTVHAVNDAPVIGTTITIPAINEGGSFAPVNLAGVATDIDGDEIILGVAGGTHVKGIITGTILQLTVDGVNWFGTEVLELLFSDGADTTKLSIACTVNPENDAPYFVFGTDATVEIKENGSQSVVFDVADIDGTTPKVTISPSVSWMTVSQSGVRATAHIHPSYELLDLVNPDSSFRFVVTVSDEFNSSLKTSKNLTVKMTNSNRSPVASSIASSNVALGDSCTTTLIFSDLDGDVVTVTPPSGVAYNSSTKKLSWKSNYTTDDVGDIKNFSIRFSDGEGSVYQTWKVAVGDNTWERVKAISEEVYDIAGKDLDEVFILSSNFYKLAGSSLTILSLLDDNLYSYFRRIEVYGDKVLTETSYSPSGVPVTYIVNKIWEINGNVATVDWEKNVSHHNKPGLEYVRGYASPVVSRNVYRTSSGWIEDALLGIQNDSVAFPEGGSESIVSSGVAEVGVNIFFADTYGGVYRKYGKGSQWYFDNTSTEVFAVVAPASLTGSITYFVNDAGNIYKTTSGTSTTNMNPAQVSGAPADIVALEAMSENILWALSSTGKLYFTNGGFAGGDWSEEDVDGKNVKAISVAEDRSTIFVLTTDNTIYRY